MCNEAAAKKLFFFNWGIVFWRFPKKIQLEKRTSMNHHFWVFALTVFTAIAPKVSLAGMLATDVSGKAEIIGKGPVSTLAQIADGSRLQISAGATLVAVDLSSGREFILSGANTYIISSAGPKTLDGNLVPAKALPANNLKEVRVAPGKLAQATLVMRGSPASRLPVLLSPLRTSVISVLPELRWESVEGATNYRLEIMKLDGSLVWDTVTTGSMASIPESRALEPGVSYSWRVEANGPSGKISDSSSRFSVASKEAIESLKLLAPTPDASFSRKVLFATQLQEAGAVQEAKALWQSLARERPDDAVLLELTK